MPEFLCIGIKNVCYQYEYTVIAESEDEAFEEAKRILDDECPLSEGDPHDQDAEVVECYERD